MKIVKLNIKLLSAKEKIWFIKCDYFQSIKYPFLQSSALICVGAVSLRKRRLQTLAYSCRNVSGYVWRNKAKILPFSHSCEQHLAVRSAVPHVWIYNWKFCFVIHEQRTLAAWYWAWNIPPCADVVIWKTGFKRHNTLQWKYLIWIVITYFLCFGGYRFKVD
jgi:hypothetical protein